MIPLKLVRTFPVAPETPDFALDAARRRLYVLDTNAPFRRRAILTFDLNAPDRPPRRLECPAASAGELPMRHAAVDPATGHLWVTVWSGATPLEQISPDAGVYLWDMERGIRVGFIAETATPKKPWSRWERVVFRERSDGALFPAQDQVIFVGGDPRSVQAVLRLEGASDYSSPIVLDEVAGEGYYSRDRDLIVVDLARRSLVAQVRVDTPAARRFPQNQRCANDIVRDPRTGCLFLAHPWPRAEVVVMDSRRRTVVARLPVGDDPGGLAIDEGLRRLYVANNHGGALGSTIQIFHLDSLALRATLFLDWRRGLDSPGRIVVDPTTHEIYVAMRTTGKIAKFRLA